MERATDYLFKITSYIRKNLKKGYTKDSLKIALLNQGHRSLSIEKAFKIVEQEMINEAPILNTKPIIKRQIIEPEIQKKSFLGRFFG